MVWVRARGGTNMYYNLYVMDISWKPIVLGLEMHASIGWAVLGQYTEADFQMQTLKI